MEEEPVYELIAQCYEVREMQPACFGLRITFYTQL